MAQLELDFAGMDYSANMKAVNPSPADGTGIFVGSFLQSITKKLAVGVEVGVQRPRPDINETQTSLVAKYSGNNFVLTSNFSQIGILQCSYYHRVSPKVELGTELQLMTAEGRRDGLCTVGGKWDFQAATFRGQIDTTGRVSAVLEEKMAPGFSILLTGDIDHVKGQSRFGIGMQLES
jgi:mitochondrial import receptor subunit TOM40